MLTRTIVLPGRSLIAAITNGNGVVLVWSGLLVLTSAIAQFAGPILLFLIIDGICCNEYHQVPCPPSLSTLGVSGRGDSPTCCVRRAADRCRSVVSVWSTSSKGPPRCSLPKLVQLLAPWQWVPWPQELIGCGYLT
jgi:hypothetical protein